jgi:hypothetical protein
MPIAPGSLSSAAQGVLTPALAAAVTTPAVQKAICDAIEAAVIAAIPQLILGIPAGLVAPPGGGPVSGSTAPGSIS